MAYTIYHKVSAKKPYSEKLKRKSITKPYATFKEEAKAKKGLAILREQQLDLQKQRPKIYKKIRVDFFIKKEKN